MQEGCLEGIVETEEWRWLRAISLWEQVFKKKLEIWISIHRLVIILFS